MLTLHFAPNSRAGRILWLLEELALPYELNRMDFHKLSFEERMKNFARLTPKKEMVQIMSDEYAKLYGRPYQIVFDKMWQYTSEFREKYDRKKDLKKKYLGK